MEKNLTIPFDVDVAISKYHEDTPEEGSSKWIVEGFVTTSDIDMTDDQIAPEALESACKDLLNSPTVLYNHDVDKEIGRVLEAEVKGSDEQKGLWVKVLISSTVPRVWKKIKEGILNKFSIRGKILAAKAKLDEKTQQLIRYITEVKLAECSIVSVAANPEAKALSWYVSKALDDYEKREGDLGLDTDFTDEDDFTENAQEHEVEEVEKHEESNKDDVEGGEQSMDAKELEKVLNQLRDFAKELSEANASALATSGDGDGDGEEEVSKISADELKSSLNKIVTLTDETLEKADDEKIQKALNDINEIAKSLIALLDSMSVPEGETGETAASADIDSLKQDVAGMKKTIGEMQESLTALSKESEGEETEKGETEKGETEKGEEVEKSADGNGKEKPEEKSDEVSKQFQVMQDSFKEMQESITTLTKTITEELPVRKGMRQDPASLSDAEKKKLDELEKLPPDQRLRKLLGTIPELTDSGNGTR